ncbi:LacI family DNA-binding transcriptional regulator [Leucobacter sp. CSA1]|uniref:LacI family DNA-binding transcriptional regulator n=1 Tax=Leucobacter chromiisoli TaxID=2796471 RepID=A0A934Q7C6_9MICO|nr:LacI family DNA-binding transcriptional regulator [Leucobacter chromiisoli]MBK0419048.1 LacI family DNA-binding transcriptional regulator [Leucobacter chromiisoli]
MADVARRAGVSVTTVSHALNSTRRVAPATVELVMQAIAETGYRHNLTARALATSSTTTIGLAMSIVTNPYFGELAGQLEERLRQAGFSLVLANTNDDPGRALDVIEDLCARQVSGIIAVPIEGSPELTEALRRLSEQRFPLVFLDRPSDLPVDQVYSDGERSVYDLAEHLALLGHRRIGFVNGTTESASGLDRLAGYRRAVEALGIEDDPEMIIEGESDERVAQTAVRRHLGSPRRAEALIVSNNQMAIGALRAIREAGLSIPHDIAVVSFDDFKGADLLSPGLTVAKQDVDLLASSAVRLLLRQVSTPGRAPDTVVAKTRFVHRESCGCPARGTGEGGPP